MFPPAIQALLERKDGGNCPMCTQRVVKRREVLYASIVHCLAIVYRHGGIDDPVPLEVIRAEQQRITGTKVQNRNDWTKNINRLPFFSLARSVKGEYLCTPTGELFLLGRHKVQKVAWTFNSEVLERSGKMVGVKEVRGIQFDLDKFLNHEL